MEGKEESDNYSFNGIAFAKNFAASWQVAQGKGISIDFFVKKSLLNCFVD